MDIIIIGGRITAINVVVQSKMIKSVFEDGYWWLVIPDELWEHAIVHDYVEGYCIYARRP